MLQAVAEQYTQQQAIAATTTSAVTRIWSRMGDDFDASWSDVGPQLIDLTERGRRAAAVTAAGYTAAVLLELGEANDPVGVLDTEAFLRTAPDGRRVDTLLYQAVQGAKGAVGSGLSIGDALLQSSRWLTMTTLTLLADTRREVFGADIVQRPSVDGYSRMLNPPSCSRCVILAGKWFRWNEGFARHPRCDCQHVPGSKAGTAPERSDPYAAFRAMTREQQDGVFGRLEARAIRDGGDIYRVVNLRDRGLATARAAARYGTPSRLTIDDIYRQAGTRTNAIRLMREEGYILERGQEAIARSPGVLTDANVIAAGRGRGVLTLAGQQVTTVRAQRFDAVAAGQRQTLQRGTMTAAERRLYDATYRLRQAELTGYVPRSVGPSSADRYATPIAATPARLAQLRRELEQQLAPLRKPNAPLPLMRLARALGLL